jgi:hypothetical protein
MDEAKSYKSAGAFRTALETRLQMCGRAEAIDLQRLRRQVAFDRFLARMFSKGPKASYPWLLKGGYAMELRMQAARTTKDIDLTLHDGTRLSKDPPKRREEVRGMLQEAAAARFDDFFEFLIGEARRDLEGAPEGDSRYPVGSANGRAGLRAVSCGRGHWGRGARAIGYRDRAGLAGIWWCGAAVVSRDLGRTAIRGKASCLFAAAHRASEHPNERSDRHGAAHPLRKTRQEENGRSNPCDIHEARDPRCTGRACSAIGRMGIGVRCLGERVRSPDDDGRRICGIARTCAEA